MFLVDDDHPDVGQRRDDRQARPDHDVDVTGTDPAPFVGALPFPEAGMDQRHPRIEVGPQPVDQRQGEGDLRHEHERRPSGLEGCRDRLDVDRGLATTRHAVEQERARVAGGDRGHDPGDRLGLGGQEVARGGPAPAPAGGPGRERPARALADLGLGQTAPDEPGGRRRSVAGGQVGRRQLAGRCRGELGQEIDLARSEGPARDRLPGGQRIGHRPPGIEEPDPALVAWPGARPQQRPSEAHPALRLERPEPAQEPGTTIGSGQVADRPRAAHELLEQVRRGPGGGIGLRAAIRICDRRVAAGFAPAGVSSATSSSRSSRPGGSIARRTRAGGAR